MIKKATIVGSGLTGPLLSILLAKKYGMKVTMYERNADTRKTNSYSGRSINLALSERGIFSLKEVGLYDEISKNLIPMRGRMIHDLNGRQSFKSFVHKLLL